MKCKILARQLQLPQWQQCGRKKLDKKRERKNEKEREREKNKRLRHDALILIMDKWK